MSTRRRTRAAAKAEEEANHAHGHEEAKAKTKTKAKAKAEAEAEAETEANGEAEKTTKGRAKRAKTKAARDDEEAKMEAEEEAAVEHKGKGGSSHALEIGKPAPDFSVPDQNGKEVTLQSFKGKWLVVYFYPKDNTPGCTKESCRFNALHGDFEALNAEVLGVSADSQKAHTSFITKFGFKFSLLSDQKRELIKAFKAGGARIQRSTVLIDPEGVVRATWNPVQGAATHPDQVLAELKKLQA